jgi:glycosyltransferase 2 family protein
VSSRPRPAVRRALLATAKAVAGLAMLGWLLSTVDPRRLAATLAQADAATVALGLALLLVAVLMQVLRLLVLAGDLVPGFGESTRITLASYLFNQLLPGGLGGEGYRALSLRRATDRWMPVIGLLTVERLLGAVALTVPGLLYLLTEHERLARLLAGRIELPAVTPAMVAAGVVLALVALAGAVLALRWRRLRERLVGSLGAGWQAVAAIGPGRYGAAFALSVLYHVLRIAGIERLLASVGQRVAAWDVLFVLFVTLLVSLLPLTLGALGVKEGTIVFGFSLYGVGRPDALAVALLNRAVLVALALAGLAAVGRRALPASVPEPRAPAPPTGANPGSPWPPSG